MPRFFFTIDDGRSAPDRTEVDLLDLAEAKSQAIRTAGEILSEIGLGIIWDGVPWSLVVTDEQGRQALEIQMVIKGHSGN